MGVQVSNEHFWTADLGCGLPTIRHTAGLLEFKHLANALRVGHAQTALARVISGCVYRGSQPQNVWVRLVGLHTMTHVEVLLEVCQVRRPEEQGTRMIPMATFTRQAARWPWLAGLYGKT